MTRFPDPPALGMLAGSVGKGLVFLAIAAFLISAISWVLQRKKLGSVMFIVGTGATVAIFAIHIALLLTRQYEYAYTYHNTENSMPTAYRLSAAWASQEGSFLLWTLMSALFAVVAARATGLYRRWYTVICSIGISAMLSITAYESPFKLLELSPEDKGLLAPGQTMVMPPDGFGLNPTLMNYWMVIHPWVIFIGFGSLLALFAWSVSAAFSGDRKSWVPQIRPFAIFSMTILGIGLTMGGLWAYETLGWGGFWAWDPVENVSLVPFIATTVFIHGLYVQGSRGRWSRGNLLLGVLPFLWFVYGTYLTRSGALVQVSVHSFAEMNAGAHGLLLGLVIATVLTVVAVVIRAFTLKSPTEEKPPGDRQPGLTIGMTLLYGVGILAAVGMSIPFLASLGMKITAFGERSVITEEVYNRIVAYPFVPALLLMAAVPFMGWTKTKVERWRTLSNLFFVTVLMFGIVAFFMVRSGLTLAGGVKMPAGQLAIFFSLIFVCLFSIVANGSRVIERLRAKAGGIGSFLMHAGISTLLLGLIVSHAFEKSQTTLVTRGAPGRLALMPNQVYLAMLESLPTEEGLADSNNTLDFTLVDEKTGARQLTKPNYYFTERDGNLVSRPSIKRTPFYDLYFVVGTPELSLAPDVELLPGETKQTGDFTVKYVQRTQVGQPGMAGTRFGAKLVVTYMGKSYDVNPEIELGGSSRSQRRAVQLGSIGLVALQRLDAATKRATVAILSPEPMFPVQMFFKPLVGLVWLGAGMMVLGGLFAVGKRRSRAKLTNSDAPA